MTIRVLLIVAAAMALASCETTSGGPTFKDRPVSTQGKVLNDYDYLT